MAWNGPAANPLLTQWSSCGLMQGPGAVLLLTGVVAGVLADGGAALSF